jgi:hypothetical protein
MTTSRKSRRRSRHTPNGPKKPTTINTRNGCLGLRTSTLNGSEQITKLLTPPKVTPPCPHNFIILTLSADTLNKTKVTGIPQVDQIQDDVNNLIGNQVGKNGLFAPVGNLASKEGINRAERGGKDDKGTYGGAASSVTDPVVKNAQGAGQGIASGAQSAGQGVVGGAQTAGSTLTDGAKGAGGYVGGLLGGGGKKEESEAK